MKIDYQKYINHFIETVPKEKINKLVRSLTNK